MQRTFLGPQLGRFRSRRSGSTSFLQRDDPKNCKSSKSSCLHNVTTGVTIEQKMISNRIEYRRPCIGSTPAGACCIGRRRPAVKRETSAASKRRRSACLFDGVSVEGMRSGWHAAHRLHCIFRFVVAVAAPIPGRVLRQRNGRGVQTTHTLCRSTGRPFCGHGERCDAMRTATLL
jgi:hypothetical protein